jgi:Kef-type K+ transport system membrane component KefB
MVVVWVMGKIFRSLSLPVIFGELLGGIIIGPLTLGIIDPSDEGIKMLAELGIFFLMFHTGLETNPKKLFNASTKSIIIGVLSTILPLIIIFYSVSALGFNNVHSAVLALTLSITGMPIVVRVFKDLKIHRTSAANVTLIASIISDLLGLILFSMLLSYIETGVFDPVNLGFMLLKSALFFAIVIFLGIKLSPYSQNFLKNKGFTLALIIALGLGVIAELLGLHMIIGAFLAGLFIREEVLDPKIFNKIEDRIYGLSYSFLGPIFFTSLAMNLDFKAIFLTPTSFLIILIIAFAAKYLASFLPALYFKMKDSNIIGSAMNSRGAIDLVIASIAFEKGAISQEVFSILIAVIFFTTLISIFSLRFYAKRKELESQ